MYAYKDRLADGFDKGLENSMLSYGPDDPQRTIDFFWMQRKVRYMLRFNPFYRFLFFHFHSGLFLNLSLLVIHLNQFLQFMAYIFIQSILLRWLQNYLSLEKYCRLARSDSF